MSFGAKPNTAGVLVPDHTHWGNEGPLLGRISDGKGIPGWDSQYSHIKVRAEFDIALRTGKFLSMTSLRKIHT